MKKQMSLAMSIGVLAISGLCGCSANKPDPEASVRETEDTTTPKYAATTEPLSW